ncbi:MAG TPA: hypothetical protein VNQ90_00235 [Chthoniobacteraceae bacterium]|nr:hypothetical protein [Chthoniobacteraceae bacterium]
MPHDDDTLSKLLRLKRHEQPPPEYFENFLREFQNRQRAEMLRRPVWRIALDRLEAFFGEFSTSQLSYATASAAVLLVAAVFTADMLQHPGGEGASGQFAQAVSHGTYEANPSLSAPFAHEPVVPFTASHVAPEDFFRNARLASQAAQSVSRAPAIQVASASGEPLTLTPKMQLKELFQDAPITRSGATHLHPRYVLDPRPVSYDAPISF